MDKRDPVIEPDWIKPGALVVTIDYDSYVTDAAIQAMDLVLTDDQGQIEDARRNEGKFPGVNRIDATVADLIAHGTGRRTSDDERILAFNLGIALAEQSGVGTPLPLRSAFPQT
jgi:ornithine cyclodeaminase/alanine dehydrogenase-like protein (mu-crystallin family)